MKCATYLIKSQPLIQRYLKGAIYIKSASLGGAEGDRKSRFRFSTLAASHYHKLR